ncbi:sugar ABC transporter ATP-binding protein [Gryllotalpicola protaetiae]|uniref:Sugar ABC transporter ATP-binding protein n=1 Tax=Gryllotalpicola protaetiae TaxID=2419771 RepID=A0A387BVS1_9MICO|nr:sugar ABC transporter ATP-binding protein [Gryllotalpicola protaetiae]AYG05226.1 sugar ABC transporter ATP-binding protein [Gryllotalpicola protaetiae]
MSLSPSARPIHLELRGIGKSYGGTPVLTDIDLTIPRGTVHGLVGENGAGKSSIGRIIAGIGQPDRGELLVDGQEVSFRSPREALAMGIATIAQELSLVPSLTVAENVYLGSEPRRGVFISSRRLRAQFLELAAGAGFELDPDAVVGGLRTADQQKVEILRAMSRGASFIIMDEPTAALSRDDTARLHDVVRRLAASDHTVLLISHFLGEVLDLADDVTILRDGRIVRGGPASAETESSLIESMLGRKLTALYPEKAAAVAGADAVLEVEGLRAPGVDDVSLAVRAGEIVGLAGLVGSGRSELAHALFGSVRRSGGVVRIGGRAVGRGSPRRALRHGAYLIPESRKEQGLVLQRPVRENVTLASVREFSIGGWIRAGRERMSAQGALRDVTVRVDAAPEPVASLSGGNQQKVLFARGMLRAPVLLIADEPTRGVDVGSRRAIYDLLVEQAARGVGVLMISSDLDEVLGLAHRVLVMRNGAVSAELEGERMTEANVLRAAFGAAGEESR